MSETTIESGDAAVKGVLDKIRQLASRVFGRQPSRQARPDAPTGPEAWQKTSAYIQRSFRPGVEKIVGEMTDPANKGTFEGSPARFVDVMTGLLKNLYLTTLAIGAGGMDRVTREEIRRADRMVAEQRRYLIRWQTQLERTPRERWSAGQIITRAMMYAESAKALLSWQATSVNVGVSFELPFQPADRTDCYNNCKCHWEVKVIDAEKGDYDCYWRMAPAEHCEICINRAKACNPLQVRGGAYTLDMRGLIRK